MSAPSHYAISLQSILYTHFLHWLGPTIPWSVVLQTVKKPLKASTCLSWVVFMWKQDSVCPHIFFSFYWIYLAFSSFWGLGIDFWPKLWCMAKFLYLHNCFSSRLSSGQWETIGWYFTCFENCLSIDFSFLIHAISYYFLLYCHNSKWVQQSCGSGSTPAMGMNLAWPVMMMTMLLHPLRMMSRPTPSCMALTALVMHPASTPAINCSA